MMKLGFIPEKIPKRMITILFAFAHIQTCCLNVAIAQLADPHFFPCRRYRKLAYSRNLIFSLYCFAFENIKEPFAFFYSVNPWISVSYIMQLCNPGGLFIIFIGFQKFLVR